MSIGWSLPSVGVEDSEDSQDCQSYHERRPFCGVSSNARTPLRSTLHWGDGGWKWKCLDSLYWLVGEYFKINKKSSFIFWISNEKIAFLQWICSDKNGIDNLFISWRDWIFNSIIFSYFLKGYMFSLKTARNKYRKAFTFSLKNETQSFLYSFELKFEKRIDIHLCNILSSEINFKPICWILMILVVFRIKLRTFSLTYIRDWRCQLKLYYSYF